MKSCVKGGWTGRINGILRNKSEQVIKIGRSVSYYKGAEKMRRYGFMAATHI